MIRALKPFFALPAATSAAEKKLAWAAWALFALTALWAMYAVPMCMDEALPYHPLACLAYPYAHLHTLREGCDNRYTLDFLGLHIPGSYYYTGFLSSALYAPVFFLLRTAQAQYWFGLAFFLAFAFFRAGLTPPPALGLPLIFSFFPFSFQFIHDTGPVRFALLIFPLGAMLLRRMTERKAGVRWVYAALLALLALLATEDKVFFLYLLPGYAFFCLAFTGEKSWPALFARLKKTWPAIMLAVVLATIGLAALFASAIDGRPYFDLLRIVAPRQAPATGFFYTLKLFIAYLLAWPAYAHRVFDMRGAMLTPSFFFFMVAAAGLFAGCVVLAVHKSPRRWLAPRPLLLALSFLATTAVFLILRNVWAGHHFIFLWPPLMVLFADLLEDAAPAARKALLGAFLALNALAVVILLWWPIDPTAARDRQAIFAYFHNDARAAQAIVNYSSWGGYYIQSLYGPRDQLVTYAQPLTPASARQLLALSRQTGRRLYDVCYNNLRDDPLQELPPLIDHRYYNSVCDQAYLEAMFGDKVRFEDLLPQQRIWHLFVAVPRD